MAGKEKHFKKEVAKADLIEYLTHTEGLTKYKAASLVNKIIEFITINIGSFNKVKISGLGSFKPHYIKPRLAYIPHSKEKKLLDPKLRVVFKSEQPLSGLLQSQITKFQQMFDVEVSDDDNN